MIVVGRIILIFSFLLLMLSLAGQERYVQVLDAENKHPLVYAHVCFNGLDEAHQSYAVTNDRGFVKVEYGGKLQVIVSYVGYTTLYDTLNGELEKKVYMRSANLSMDHVVITGQYTPQRADRSLYKIEVIPAREIQQKPVNNLAELLSASVNMQIRQDGATGSNLSMQGLSGENVKILIDGVPVIGRLDGEIDLSQINLNNVERIEIIEGPMSVSYGTNALAGVINIITKDNVNGSTEVFVNTYAESVGKLDFDASVGIAKKKNDYILSAHRRFFSGFDSDNDSRSLAWKPKRQYGMSAKWKRKLGKTNLRFSTDFFDEYVLDKGIPFRDVDTVNQWYYMKARDGYYYTQRANNSLSWSGIVGKEYFVDAIAAHSWFKRKRLTYLKNLYSMDKVLSASSGDNDTSVFNAVVARAYISKFQRDSMRFNFQLGFDVNLDQGSGDKILESEQRIGDYAVFGGVRFNMANRFTIQPAIRVSYNTAYESPLVPSLNLKYVWNKNFLIRASYAQGFRAPSLKELYLDFVDLNHKIFGNTDLKAEYSDNINLQLVYQRVNAKHLWKIEPNVFYNDIRNKINLFPKNVITGGDTSQIWLYGNIDRFKTSGGNLKLSYNQGDRFKVQTVVGYIGRWNGDVDEVVESWSWTPEVSMNIDYKIQKLNSRLIFVYKYTGEYLRERLDDNNALVLYREDDFHTLDISLNKFFYNEALALSFGGKNLFDVTDINSSIGGGGVHSGGSGSRPVSWGRTWFISLKYNFSHKPE